MTESVHGDGQHGKSTRGGHTLEERVEEMEAEICDLMQQVEKKTTQQLDEKRHHEEERQLLLDHMKQAALSHSDDMHELQQEIQDLMHDVEAQDDFCRRYHMMKSATEIDIDMYGEHENGGGQGDGEGQGEGSGVEGSGGVGGGVGNGAGEVKSATVGILADILKST
eukprot:GFYU01032195.1.p1 GENE.GFYU01032195.1~~GFYU01032195.1.p1  ORF type:complete len:193 (-),score=56.77 GFYU01032195.1:181-681(-)